jgi:hypothetical protein
MARLAKSLETLRAEVNGYAPRRNKRSDGWIGDPAHASRASRHNANRYGVVCALDLTHDPAGGCDIHSIARRLVLTPHPELAYVISDGRVAKRATGFRWEPYRGTNKHTLHAHFAVGTGPDSDPLPPYDSTLSWGVSIAAEGADDLPLTDADLTKIGALIDDKLAAHLGTNTRPGQNPGPNTVVGRFLARIGQVQGNLADLIRERTGG